MDATRGTFSIVAADPEAGEVGVAVQSKYFAVGAVVPWAKAGVGAVATQAAGVAAYGPRALEALEQGLSPEEALERVLADDAERDTRQLGVVAADGRIASWTGEKCNDWAGAAAGEGFTAQGNILAGEAVVTEMARAYEQTSGPLAGRLVAALEAGQAAGGDRRGQQSAAIVVERAGAAEEARAGVALREGIDRVLELRVEDHPQPIVELRRLFEISQRWDALRRSMSFYEAKEWDAGILLMEDALARHGDDAMLLFNVACFESRAGRREAALVHLRRAVELDPSTREMVAADSDFDAMREDLAEL